MTTPTQFITAPPSGFSASSTCLESFLARLDKKMPLKNYLVIPSDMVQEFFKTTSALDFEKDLVKDISQSSAMYYVNKTQLQFKRNSSFLDGNLHAIGAIDNDGECELVLSLEDKALLHTVLLQHYGLTKSKQLIV